MFLVGRTRIHIDAVEDLGDFIEVEVVLDGSEEESIGEKKAITLMQDLGIDETNLIECAYVDLIEKAGG